VSDPLLTPAQVADQLCLSIGAVTRALREGRIPGFKLLGVWRVRRDELESWIESSRVSRQSEDPGEDFLAEVHRIREERGNERSQGTVGSMGR